MWARSAIQRSLEWCPLLSHAFSCRRHPRSGRTGPLRPLPGRPHHHGRRVRRREIGFTSLHEKLAPLGRLVFRVFSALAEFIRALIVAGTREGLAAAKTRGRTGGRPSVVNAELLKATHDLLPGPRRSVTSIA
ncbi:recombinase family protein [Nonomuraea sp. NPDC050663]|uniref:recombinase family protein n=1 Tax=Nonomuraea sp. NPDC050663 TaxID=3364370 RepID=UPI0037A6F32C